MKLADVNNALNTARGQYTFYLEGGHEITGRISGVAPTNDLLIVHYTRHSPPSTTGLRVLIRTDAIVAIAEE